MKYFPLALGICLVALFSCQGDDLVEQDQNSENIPTQGILDESELDIYQAFPELKIQSYNSKINTPSQFNSSNQNTRIAPELDSLYSVFQALLELEATEPYLAGFITTFGLPAWDYSGLITSDDGLDYYISIPWVKDDTVSGVLQYMLVNDAYYLRMIDASSTILELYDNSNTNEENFSLMALLDLFFYKLKINGAIDQTLYDFLPRPASDDGIEVRYKDCLVRHIYDYSACGQAFSDPLENCRILIEIRIECFSTGGSRGGSWSGGGPSSFPSTGGWRSIPRGGSGNPGGGPTLTVEYRKSEARKNATRSFKDKYDLNMDELELIDLLKDCTVLKTVREEGQDVFRATVNDNCARNKIIDYLFDDCEGGISPDALAYMKDLMFDSELSDPCNPNKKADDIAQDMADLICPEAGNESLSVDEIELALDRLDHVIVDPHLANSCPRAYCIINSMQKSGSNSTSFTRELFSEFDGSTGCNNGNGEHMHFLGISFSSEITLNNMALASAFIDTDTKRPTVGINTDNCTNSSVIDTYETIQHEMVHADIKRRLKEYGWDGVDPISYGEAFNLLVSFEYPNGASQDEHELMVDFYLDKMIQSLIDANGGVGMYSDFEGLVLNGFPASALNPAGISQADVQAKLNHHQAFASNANNLSNINSTCP